MNKAEFISSLRVGLSALPQSDVDNSVEYYSEIIDDYIENGMSEEEATAAVGSIGDIISEILAESYKEKPIETEKKSGGLKWWGIVLIALGSPIWLSLLIAFAAIVFSIYVVLWSLVLSGYAVFVSFGAAALSCIFAAVTYFTLGSVAEGVLFIGGGLMCAGLTVLLLIGCNKLFSLALKATKSVFNKVKNCFTRKEARGK